MSSLVCMSRSAVALTQTQRNGSPGEYLMNNRLCRSFFRREGVSRLHNSLSQIP
jgi:hypothetical protein